MATLEEKLAEKQRKLEQDLLTGDWRYTEMGNGSRNALSMPAKRLDEARRDEMLALLKDKYNIRANITHSASMGNVDVLRIESSKLDDDVKKMTAVLFMATPESWRRNILEKTSGRRAEALNLNLDKLSPMQVTYTRWLMNRCNIRTETVTSESLGGVRVLRIEGDENLARLRRTFPTLDCTIKAKKFPAPKTPAL